MDNPKDEDKTKSQQSEENIAKGLSSLKAAGKLKYENPAEKETLESKMPSRTPKSEEEDIYRKIEIPRAKGKEDNKTADSSIFKGRPEVSRRELVQQLKKDPEVWEAQNRAGLNLSPVERAKLGKEVFSPSLGADISRADLRSSVRKLNRKMIGAKDPVEHAKIRKEIKFFKKIGGL